MEIGRSAKDLAAVISSVVNKIAREKGEREAMIADYVLKEVLIRGSRDPRIMRLAFYYIGNYTSLSDEDQKLKSEIGAALPSPGDTIRSILKSLRISGEESEKRKADFLYIHMFAGA